MTKVKEGDVKQVDGDWFVYVDMGEYEEVFAWLNIQEAVDKIKKLELNQNKSGGKPK